MPPAPLRSPTVFVCPDDEQLCALFEGRLAPAMSAELDEHVAVCPRCRVLVGELGQTFSRHAHADATASAEVMRSRDGVGRGASIGRFVVLDILGVGAMSVVYSAYDPELDRGVALKLLQADSGPEARAQNEAGPLVLREAQAIARVSHPNVVSVFDVGTFHDRIFMAMELVAGTTLTKWLTTPRRWEEVLAVFVAAGRGLAAAHAVDVIHRDFKPDNVLIGREGQVKVVDFGLARARRASSVPPVPQQSSGVVPRDLATISRGLLIGTPAYMAPEQRKGRAADARSDQFSFCVSLHEALFGHRPEEPATAGPSRRVPTWLRRAIQVGLSPNPGARHPSMAALLDAVEAKPRRRRQRAWFALALGAATVVAASASYAAQAHRAKQALEAPICGGAEAEVASAWNAEKKRAIADAFAKTGKVYAGPAAARVGEQLDRYAYDWTRGRTDACIATRVRKVQSEALLDERMRCLDGRLGELRAMANELARGDALSRAATAVDGLPPVASCDTASGRAEPEERESVDLLGRARVATLLSNRTEGTKLGQEVLDRARAHGRRRLEAGALEVLGTLAGQARDADSASRLLFDAFATADESGAKTLAATSAIGMVWSLSLKKNEAEEEERWMRVASGAVRRAGSSPELLAKLAMVHADLLAHRGDLVAARNEARGAVERLDVVPPASPVSLGQALARLSVLLHELGDTEDAIATLRRSLRIYEDTFGPEHPEIGLILQNLGAMVATRDRGDEALALYDRALSIYTRSGEQAYAVTLTHAAMAHVLTKLGRRAEGRAHVVLAMQLAEAPGVPALLRAQVVAERAFFDRLDRRYDDALTGYARATSLFHESIPANHPLAVGVVIDAALVHLDRGTPAKAVPLLEQAIAALAGGAAPDALAEARLALAQALVRSGREKERAKGLAHEGREYYRTHAEHAADVESLEGWLSAHRVG